MKRLLFATFLAFIAINPAFCQTPDAEGSLVKWMSLTEAMKKMETQPRPVLMDFYTDWCGWCKHMMKTTYAAPDLAQYINTNFYPVKYNAEGKDTIEYLGKKYMPVTTEGRATHPLTTKLLGDKLVYPTTLFMNNYDKDKKEFVFSMMAQGYLENKKIEPMLIFTLENIFRNSNFDDFNAQFAKAFNEKADENDAKAGWKKPAEVFGKKDSNDKKTLVLIHTDWCNGCRVMKRTSFTDSISATYLKKKFELVEFNPESNDTVTYKGQVYTNQHSPQMPFHSLAVTLCRNSLTLPSVVVLDEKMNILDVIPFYLNPKVLKDIATFYGNDIFKKKSWVDFMADANKKQ